ncbi:hypothetical protein [Streptoalloteichus hindustanus]|uniref:Immunity protein 50 n=1 Tax=Streptoalloteichus hindustanus TaxID=2017 RepID=A0A1M5DND4_STRHI|nr:hypothetical protein [Streptoalloteichus hindustanus]SHF68497.1 hypothetical protein SAMN05444320_104536 [Streptoalloteichus hindustanus]
MKYVRLEPLIDPEDYLDKLGAVADALPPGAREFATDPGHYDFGSDRCVKDLTVEALGYDDDHDRIALEIVFGPNPWKHTERLTVRYRGVVDLSLQVGPKPLAGRRLGSVVLDEILPHEQGCRHEIALHAGSIVVVAADLTAVWSAPTP